MAVKSVTVTVFVALPANPTRTDIEVILLQSTDPTLLKSARLKVTERELALPAVDSSRRTKPASTVESPKDIEMKFWMEVERLPLKARLSVQEV